ncbi:MAG: hypothetical protein L0Z07_07055 [Planctomycetes bacterium]|nr:hypothetical protein [Planctomycetota bacterium]
MVAIVLVAWSQARESVLPTPANSPVAEKPLIIGCRIGFSNHYKIGHWTPVWVDLDGTADSENAQIEMTVPDSDGVETTVVAPLASTGGNAAPHRPTTTPFYVKIGRMAAPIRVSLVIAGKEADHLTLDPMASPQHPSVFQPLAVSSELIVSLGGKAIALDNALANRDAEGGRVARRVVEIGRVDDLPDQWFGYEAVDLFVLSASDEKLCRELSGDERRLAAIRRWIELGGRLAVLSGGHQANELFGNHSPLAVLLPGMLVNSVDLSDTTSLEHFAGVAEPISEYDRSRTPLLVPKLGNVRGIVEAYAGRKPTDLPLVIRAPLGLGEVSFAGVDLAVEPLVDWSGRADCLRAFLRPYVSAGDKADTPQTLGTLGYNDLAGGLRQQLGHTFDSVTTITFPLVAMLVVGYLLLLGPASYWIARHFGGRPEIAWLVFPLLVLATSGAAYWIGLVSKGDRARTNQLELVDVDFTSMQARGTYWAALYSPRSERFDLGLDVRLPAHATLANHEGVERIVSWWGLLGMGVGGMQAGGVDMAVINAGYRFTPPLDAMLGVPVLTSGVKSLTARWTAPVQQILDAQLRNDDGLLAGSLTNETGDTLTNAHLLYGSLAYRLGDLGNGKRIEIGQNLDPFRVHTFVTRGARGRDSTGKGELDRGVFLADHASSEQLLMLMMFYQAAGGEEFARLPSRYQSYCDLSRLLELGRAILVAYPSSEGSQLIDHATGRPPGDDQRRTRTVYRFVIPVARSD